MGMHLFYKHLYYKFELIKKKVEQTLSI